MSANINYLHAGMVEPGLTRFVITEPHEHLDLRKGDIVVMSVMTGTWGNVLIREPDMTLHSLKGKWDQYVHIEACR